MKRKTHPQQIKSQQWHKCCFVYKFVESPDIKLNGLFSIANKLTRDDDLVFSHQSQEERPSNHITPVLNCLVLSEGIQRKYFYMKSNHIYSNSTMTHARNSLFSMTLTLVELNQALKQALFKAWFPDDSSQNTINKNTYRTASVAWQKCRYSCFSNYLWSLKHHNEDPSGNIH